MKKLLVALVTIAMMVSMMVPAFAEVWAGEGEIIPEIINVPQATTKPVIDGFIEESFWGTPFIVAKATSRAESELFVHPRDGSYLDLPHAGTSDSEAYFRWDAENLYIAIKVKKVYESEVDEKALWRSGVDCGQFYIGSADGTKHIGWGLNSNQDCVDTYVWVFEQDLPNAADATTCEEGIRSLMGTDDTYTYYEMALPLSDCLGAEGKVDDCYLFSYALFLLGTHGYQVGQAVFNADKTTVNSPMLVFSEAPVVEEETTEEPEVTEPEVTETEVTEPEVEEEEETPAPSTTTNPSTADVSVLFYALAAISAIGGISVFKRK